MTNANFKAGGSSHASNENQWRAYDRLPPSIRKALQESAFDWAPYPIWRRFEAGENTAKEYVKKIAEWDRSQIKKDRKRVWKV